MLVGILPPAMRSIPIFIICFNWIETVLADISEGESEIPKAQCGGEGPVRCNTWGGYVNPGTVFLENGTKGRWNFCGTIFPVTDTKYWFISDKSSLPELYYGAYEFDVWGKYVYYDVKNPVYVFIIDVSAEAHTNGLFTQALQAISLTLDSLPNASNTKIWIITVDEFVHWYVVPDDSNKYPAVYNCWEVLDPFLPIPTSKIMLNVVSDREKIDRLIEKLPEINKFEDAKHKIAALNLSSAFWIAYEILESWGGRILTFYSRIENCGPEINTVTDSLKVFNTEGEKSLFTPTSIYYNDLSVKLFMKRITVDIFWGTSHNLNIVNPAQLWTRTGGDVYYYRNFRNNSDGEKLNYEVFRVLTRNNAYDVAFRVRWSDGYSVIAYTGNFVRINAVDFELPSIDADKTIGVMMRSEGSVPRSDRLSIQAALLYSTPDGERKIRILNLYLPLEKKFSSIFKYVDQYSLHQLMIKDSLSNVGIKTVVNIKEHLIGTIVKILTAFRSEGVTVTNPTEIIIPDSLSFIWIYTLGLIKSPAFKMLGEIKVDEKNIPIF